MYFLSVGAIFKNESHSMKEWLDHYIHHGVEHFYMINDGSTDNFMDILKEYIDDQLITLFDVAEPYYCGRQRNMYNRYILPHIKETQWLLMIDLDEYVWSKKNIRLDIVLRDFKNFGQIQLVEALFGSNGYEKQPKYIVQSFTKRKTQYNKGKYKYFVNSNFEFASLNVHHADFKNKDLMSDFSVFIIAFPEYFIMNHYNCQSRELWDDVKCTRGDSDNYTTRKPTTDKNSGFFFLDLNETEDLELFEQNKILYI